MPFNNNFFVYGLGDKANDWIIKRRISSGGGTDQDAILEVDERFFSVDLICEGPIEGLVDKDGYLLKYCTSENPKDVDDIILGKGVYYNNVPLIDSKLNKFNFVNSGFEIDYGDEIKNINNGAYASTVYKYDQRLYLAEKTSLPFLGSTNYEANAQICEFSSDSNNNYNDFFKNNKFNKQLYTALLDHVTRTAGTKDKIFEFFETSKNYCQEFTHKINNKYADQVSVVLSINNCFSTNDGGGTNNYGSVIAIELSEDYSAAKYYVILNIVALTKSPSSIDIPIDLNLNSLNNNNYYIKVYSLSQRVDATNGNHFFDVSINSIIERVRYRGNFYYPFSSIVKSIVSAKHFSSDPSRSFDLKLLKIKVPSNYDPEVREHKGNWNGKFDSFLRWTDNPAWIFYDICTNSRYGIGNGYVYDKDLNKWELYKLSQYCDELVKVEVPYAYDEDEFTISYSEKNKIYITKSNNLTLAEFKEKYPPVWDSVDGSNNTVINGLNNSIIFLYDLKNSNGDISKNYKKIIWRIKEMKTDVSGNMAEVTDGTGDKFEMELINDFGPKKFFQSDKNNIALEFSETYAKPINQNLTLSERIANNSQNTESGAKTFILKKIRDLYANNFLGISNPSAITDLFREDIINPDYFVDQNENQITPDSIIRGKCLPKKINYRDPLEPRFTCNLLLDNEVNSLKILNDISSIFRGITYYKNNFITATVDVNKPVSYIFSNSNVKDGLFSYSTGNLEGLYTVARITYKDKFENFNDQVEIVEDSELIKNYGIIVKDIAGFGITSRDQARRIGRWLLATNRFENQTISFATDLQGILLKPGDVIEVKDQFKNNSTLQGRVTDLNYDQNYIVVDRQLNLNLIGQKIKFICDNVQLTVEDLNLKSEVSNDDIDQLNNSQIIEFKIYNIDNSTNRVYLDTSYNISKINKIIDSTVFIINDINTNDPENLFKIISISESNNNEYVIFCVKHDIAKYDFLEKNEFVKNINSVNNTIAYSNSDFIQEIQINNLSSNLSLQTSTLSQVYSSTYDYSLSEPSSTLVKSDFDTTSWALLTIDFTNIFADIVSSASSSSYYKNILNVFTDGGGILCQITVRNQSIKFTVKYSEIANKTIFLGKFGINDQTFKSSAFIRMYLFDKNSKIINPS